ncbi:MAG: hypothetical protein ACRDIX_09275 [Actinomycetota bacterium]
MAIVQPTRFLHGERRRRGASGGSSLREVLFRVWDLGIRDA